MTQARTLAAFPHPIEYALRLLGFFLLRSLQARYRRAQLGEGRGARIALAEEHGRRYQRRVDTGLAIRSFCIRRVDWGEMLAAYLVDIHGDRLPLIFPVLLVLSRLLGRVDQLVSG